jgi:heme exporter protein CcmD
MQAANHMGFIVAAYGTAIAVVGGLTAWVMLDYRTQLRNLADLEKRGVIRRSAPPHPQPAREPTKEEA